MLLSEYQCHNSLWHVLGLCQLVPSQTTLGHGSGVNTSQAPFLAGEKESLIALALAVPCQLARGQSQTCLIYYYRRSQNGQHQLAQRMEATSLCWITPMLPAAFLSFGYKNPPSSRHILQYFPVAESVVFSPLSIYIKVIYWLSV